MLISLDALCTDVAQQIRTWLADGQVAATEAPDGVAPDVVLVGVSDEGAMGPFDVPNCPVLAFGREAQGPALVHALEAGVQGYSALDLGPRALGLALHTVSEGHAYIPPVLLGGLLHELVQVNRAQRPVADERFDRLSKREREVLDLLAAGKDQVGIARTLVISPQTARTHIQNVLGKLEVHSRLEAVALAVEHRQIGERSER